MLAWRFDRSRTARLVGAASLLCAGAWAQIPLTGTSGNIRIINTDMATLESQEVRKDLPCNVSPVKPALGFDLRFHGGYDVSIPLKELAGAENMLTIILRVTADSRKDDPTFFVQHIKVPAIEENSKGDATLNGVLDMGEGNYHVDWLMRDRLERICSFYWDSEASLPSKDKTLEVALPPGVVEPMQVEQFTDEPPVQRAAEGQPLNIKVMVNFAPQYSGAAALRPADTLALVTMLRRISREPDFGNFSVVAFNIQEQKVLYRQSSGGRIDFPALGEAIQKIKPGTIDTKRLAQKHGDTEFLTELIKDELNSADRPDALIFAGPKAILDQNVPEDELKPYAEDVDYPIFYLNYNLYPQAIPWKDAISRAVKIFRGTEFTISRPRDLFFTVSEMVSRIVKLKHGRSAGSGSAQ